MKSVFCFMLAAVVLSNQSIAGPQEWPMEVQASSTVLDVRYEEALRLYRQKNHAAALSILGELHRSNPDETRYLHDYLAVAAWSGRHDLALAVAGKINLDAAPAYVLEAIAASQHKQAAHEAALATYSLVGKRFPERIEMQAGRINVLIDMLRYKDAEAELRALREKYPGRPEFLEAAIRLSDAQNQPIRTLLEAESLLKIKPDDAFALRMRFYALKKLGAAHLAAHLTPLSVLSQPEQVAAKRDQLAFELRWARVNADNMEQLYRWREMDAVISSMQEICKLGEGDASESAVARGGCGDLVVALSDRRRMKESIALYEKMLDRKWVIPPYVYLSAAAAYLYEQQPEKARDIFAAALPQDPNNLNGRLGYIYSLLECEQYDDAYHQADLLIADTNEWINPKFPEIRQPNPAYRRAQLTGALVRSYTDRFADGEVRLHLLAKRAPHNAEIRQSLASTYGLRGWHHRAESDLEWLQALDTSDVSTKLGLFENRMAMSDFRGAEQPLVAAARLMPDEKSAQKAQREWETHNLHELAVDARYGQSAGSGIAQNGSHESTIDVRLYSAPYEYDWRFFAHTQFASTAFPGLTANRTTAGGGVEYRARDFSAAGEIFNMGHNGTGLAVNGEYRIDDHWSVNGMAESKSLSAPMRAYVDYVNASNYQAGMSYRWHESRSLGLTASQMNFSDGNQRRAIDALWKERLVTGPVYKLESTIEYYASHNSSQSPLINYFNPVRDHYIGLSFRNEWMHFHRYERALKHVLTVGAGSYAQQNFASGEVMNVLYEQIYRPGDRLELRYGIGRAVHPYDGVRDTVDFINFAASWMF